MSTFSRNLNKNIINSLKNDNFFKNVLLPNCQKPKKKNYYPLFPAIRPNSVCFYYRGGRAFIYDANGFKTHYKYAGLLPKKKNLSISTSYIQDRSKPIDFSEYFEGIIEYCSMYARPEAEVVSQIYSKYSYMHSNSEYVLLDIEVAFEELPNELPELEDIALKSRKSIDKIDVVILDKKKGELHFVEVKLYNNSELRKKKGITPPIINQIIRYEEQLIANNQIIIDEYNKYITHIDHIFGKKIPAVQKINPSVKLWVFDFDDDQKNGAIFKSHKENIATQYEIEYKKKFKTERQISAHWLGNVESLKFPVHLK